MPTTPADARKTFPATENLVYLDAAAVSLISQPVYDAIRSFLDICIQPGSADASRHHLVMDLMRHRAIEEAAVLLENIEDPSALADFLAANLGLPLDEKQQLLEELDASKRLERISVALAKQVEVLELSHKIQGRVRESIDKNQREYFLQEQLKAIQSELGQEDRRTQELRQLNENIKEAK
ncbi:MAG: hypothetical protein E4G90_10145, partial [Gemmatimonadales bacterium]